MTTTTTPRLADQTADCLAVCLRYGRMLAEDIPAEQFTRLPRPGMNHPAFLLGHITLVTSRALAAVGREDLADIPDGCTALFSAGRQCLENDEGYPSKDDIVAFYAKRHEDAIAALRDTPDEVYRQDNPADRESRARFPTVGSLVNFIVNCHHMAHLGQLSAWRRAMGLPSVLDA
jgi:hypothetical protein